MNPDPRVAVEHPRVTKWDGPGTDEVTSLLHVTCSSCGEVTDWESNTDDDRHRLQELAKVHANEVHDGLVDAVGWAR